MKISKDFFAIYPPWTKLFLQKIFFCPSKQNNFLFLGKIHFLLGHFFSMKGEGKSALFHYLEGEKLFEKFNLSLERGFCSWKIGEIYFLIHQYELAQTYYEKSFSIFCQIHLEEFFGSLLFSMAWIEFLLKNREKGKNHLSQSLNFALKANMEEQFLLSSKLKSLLQVLEAKEVQKLPSISKKKSLYVNPMSTLLDLHIIEKILSKVSWKEFLKLKKNFQHFPPPLKEKSLIKTEILKIYEICAKNILEMDCLYQKNSFLKKTDSTWTWEMGHLFLKAEYSLKTKKNYIKKANQLLQLFFLQKKYKETLKGYVWLYKEIVSYTKKYPQKTEKFLQTLNLSSLLEIVEICEKKLKKHS